MKKFTLIELLIVIAIIGILMSILLPSLTKARDTTRRAVCKSNQAQIMRGLFISVKTNKGKVPIGTIPSSLRYSMSIWDVNRYNNVGDGWMAFGHIYRDNEMKSVDVWDCPSRKLETYWQRPRKNAFPPGENPNRFTHSAFAVRSTNEWVWNGYRDPVNMPFLSQMDSNISYMSDIFVGRDLYSDRHGKYKINIFTKLNGAVLQTQNGSLHKMAVGNGEYKSVNNSTVQQMWQILDEL